MSLLNKVSYAPLQPGQYQCIILAYEEAQDKDKKYNFVKFSATTLPDNRPFNFNMFELGLDIMVSELRQQLINPTDTATYSFTDILDKAKTTPVNIWISYADVNGKQYRNHNFRAPKPIDPTSTTVSEF